MLKNKLSWFLYDTVPVGTVHTKIFSTNKKGVGTNSDLPRNALGTIILHGSHFSIWTTVSNVPKFSFPLPSFGSGLPKPEPRKMMWRCDEPWSHFSRCTPARPLPLCSTRTSWKGQVSSQFIKFPKVSPWKKSVSILPDYYTAPGLSLRWYRDFLLETAQEAATIACTRVHRWAQ